MTLVTTVVFITHSAGESEKRCLQSTSSLLDATAVHAFIVDVAIQTHLDCIFLWVSDTFGWGRQVTVIHIFIINQLIIVLSHSLVYKMPENSEKSVTHKMISFLSDQKVKNPKIFCFCKLKKGNVCFCSPNYSHVYQNSCPLIFCQSTKCFRSNLDVIVKSVDDLLMPATDNSQWHTSDCLSRDWHED